MHGPVYRWHRKEKEVVNKCIKILQSKDSLLSRNQDLIIVTQQTCLHSLIAQTMKKPSFHFELVVLRDLNMFARISTEFAKKSSQFFFDGCNLCLHLQILYRCFGRTPRCSYIRNKVHDCVKSSGMTIWHDTPSILRQSRDNFDHFDLRHIVFLILATLENKICPYDYIFNVTAFREFKAPQ